MYTEYSYIFFFEPILSIHTCHCHAGPKWRPTRTRDGYEDFNGGSDRVLWASEAFGPFWIQHHHPREQPLQVPTPKIQERGGGNCFTWDRDSSTRRSWFIDLGYQQTALICICITSHYHHLTWHTHTHTSRPVVHSVIASLHKHTHSCESKVSEGIQASAARRWRQPAAHFNPFPITIFFLSK